VSFRKLWQRQRLIELLLLVCASVAGVLLMRQLRRERDQAVRLALGATQRSNERQDSESTENTGI